MIALEPCPLCGMKTAPTMFPPIVGGEALWQITCDMTRGGCGLTIKRGLRLHVLAAWDIRWVPDETPLRDRLAAQALQGLLAYPDSGVPSQTIDAHVSHFAALSYRYADAMLAARMEGRP